MTKALALAIVVALAACGKAAPTIATSPMPTAPADAITKDTENGPVKATVKVWPAAPTLAEPLYLELTVSAEPGVMVEVPEQVVAFGRFKVDKQLRDDRRDGDRRVTVQTYVLAALASGRHRLPPLRVEVDDQRGSGSTAAQELLTEEIPVDVAPVPGVTVEATLRAPRGPLATEVGARPRWIIIGPVAAVGLALVIGLLLWRRRVRRAIELKVSAYDVAIATLAKLERRGGPEGDAVDAWYVELSAVIRQYLEGRYDIRAPELTTEEFMQVAARNPALTPAHRDLLAAFMRDADQVKFAGVRPSADEALAALRAARGFVDDTRYVGADAAPTPAQAVAA